MQTLLIWILKLARLWSGWITVQALSQLEASCLSSLAGMVDCGKKLVEYTRSGACKVYSKEKIEAQSSQIDNKRVTSNDIHILALARVSGCRLLFSRDHALSEDFRNRGIIPPRDGHAGRIY